MKPIAAPRFERSRVMRLDAEPAAVFPLLGASGFSDADMLRWHASFEQSAPDRHRAVLAHLCLPQDEIAAIRARSPARPTAPARASLETNGPGRGFLRSGLDFQPMAPLPHPCAAGQIPRRDYTIPGR